MSSAYPIHGSASEVNRLGADAQVISCHGLLVFHPFVEQLTVFYISHVKLETAVQTTKNHMNVTSSDEVLCTYFIKVIGVLQ